MQRERAASLVEGLFDSWGPSLYRYAFSVTRQRDVADDLVQEVFLSLYNELCSSREVASPRAWTLAVMRNQIASYCRHSKRLPATALSASLLDSLPQPGCDTDRFARESDLARLLGVLTRREKDVVILRFESLKLREIAEKLEISPKTVATLLSRALRKLSESSGRPATVPAKICGGSPE